MVVIRRYGDRPLYCLIFHNLARRTETSGTWYPRMSVVSCGRWHALLAVDKADRLAASAATPSSRWFHDDQARAKIGGVTGNPAGDANREDATAGATCELSDEEGEEWCEIVDRLPADWFARETHALLVQYCRHVVAARRVSQLIAEFKRLALSTSRPITTR